MMDEINYIVGMCTDITYQVGQGGITRIRQSTFDENVYWVYQKEHLHAKVIGVAKVVYKPPSKED